MRLKHLARSWGKKVVIGESARVARVYASAKKVTVNLSQARHETWDRFVKVQPKYPRCTKIEEIEAVVDGEEDDDGSLPQS